MSDKKPEKTVYLNISKERSMQDITMACLQNFLSNVKVNYAQNTSCEYITMKYCEIMNFVNIHFDYYSKLEHGELVERIDKIENEFKNMKPKK